MSLRECWVTNSEHVENNERTTNMVGQDARQNCESVRTIENAITVDVWSAQYSPTWYCTNTTQRHDARTTCFIVCALQTNNIRHSYKISEPRNDNVKKSPQYSVFIFPVRNNSAPRANGPETSAEENQRCHQIACQKFHVQSHQSNLEDLNVCDEIDGRVVSALGSPPTVTFFLY